MTNNQPLDLQPNPLPEKPEPDSHDELGALVSGLPQAIAVQDIEGELRRLWKSTASAGQPVMRACVLNLLIYTRSREEAERAGEIAIRLMRRHPNRAIILQTDPAEPTGTPDQLESLVTISCLRPRPDSPTVCCEQITIKASGAGVEQLSSSVLPLLVTDVPVVLWWPGDPPFGKSLYRGLVSVADYLVIDSSSFADPLVEIAQLAARTQRRYALCDLNWTRLNPWRALTAQFFDAPSSQVHLSNIQQVNVQYGKGEQPNPIQAMLIIGWLGSRLGWQLGKAPATGNLANQSLIMRGPNRQNIIVNLRAVEPLDAIPGSIVELHLITPNAEFSITQTPGESSAHVMAQLKDGATMQRVVPLRLLSEAELLDMQLAIRGRDPIYEQALTLGAQLITL